MTFWEWLYRASPGWPSERQWVMVALLAVLAFMLQMAVDNPGLWDVELFKIILQALAITGLLNMILAFHFAANKSDEAKTENTGKALDAIKAAAQSGSTEQPDVTLQPGETAQAADR